MCFLPLPENHLPKYQLSQLILTQEIRGLLVSPSLWVMLIIVSLLVGFSFFQAVDLFSQASQTALSFPEMASGMNPLEGIFVPTFGAYYLSQTLLLPFVAIRLIGLDKQSGALKLLLQLPLSPFALCTLKIAAMGLVWLISLIPAVSTLLVWQYWGGHISVPEIATLLAGHALYSLTVTSIAMFAATISDSLPTAAMFCLAVTLGSWVLDFAASGQSGLLGTLGNVSLTGMLRQFENGLLTTTYIISFLSLASLFFLLTVIWLHPGHRLLLKIGKSFVTILVLSFVVSNTALAPLYLDVTENRRHSFNPADTRALKNLQEPLTIIIHLDPLDSRLLDMEQDVLAKLRRNVPKLIVKYSQAKQKALFSATEDDNYGIIEYEYNNQHDQSYSNSQHEILPIIYKLAGLQVVPDPVSTYQGHPHIAEETSSRWWFYIFLPLLFLSAGIYGRRGKW
jgi:hypothetical protein